MGLHAADLEEDAIAKALAAGESAETAIPEKPDLNSFDLLALLAGGTDGEPVGVAEPITLVETTPRSSTRLSTRSRRSLTPELNISTSQRTRSSRSIPHGTFSGVSACCRRATSTSRRSRSA